jgi:hypothetical protein
MGPAEVFARRTESFALRRGGMPSEVVGTALYLAPCLELHHRCSYHCGRRAVRAMNLDYQNNESYVGSLAADGTCLGGG